MNDIDTLARAIYAVNDPDDEPSAEDLALYRISAVLARAKGPRTTAEDVHDAWSAWQSAIFPGHRSIVPFDQLEERVQRMDATYVEAIHRIVAQRVKP